MAAMGRTPLIRKNFGQLAPLANAEEKYLADLAEYEIEKGAKPVPRG
jgi:hypothetical protein